MITATTPNAERIITVAQRPGTVVEFDTFDETGHTGTATGTIAHDFGMGELGNRGYAVITADGERHNVSRYAFVIPQPAAERNTGTVTCENCGDRHVAEYHHNGRKDWDDGDTRYFEVECDKDRLVGYYTEEHVDFTADETPAIELDLSRPAAGPSVKQMANRANTGHYNALKAYRDAASLDTPGLSDGEARGYRTCIHTLVQWECVADGKITDRGLDLIAAYETKWNIR